MKVFLFFLLINIYLIDNLAAYEYIYDSEFYRIDINNEIIEDSKKREINKIKIKSLEFFLNNILTKPNLRSFKRNYDINKNVNNLIKNIIIEDEFISTNKYYSKVKINFDLNEIIKLIRKQKISYTDIVSSPFLYVAVNNDKITNHGLIKDNLFYQNFNLRSLGLINFIKPELSANDRFILPYHKIVNKDLNAFNNIANKYEVDFIVFAIPKESNNINHFNIMVFNKINNNLDDIGQILFTNILDYEKEISNLVSDWWKKRNIINNSLVNDLTCYIKSQNIHELQFINSKINSFSQTKSNRLINIKYGMNLNKINFFDDKKNLILKLSSYNINLIEKLDNHCYISTK